MNSWFASKTYHVESPLRTPAVRGLLLFLFFALLLSALLQWVGQSALSEVLPPPSLDFHNPEFNTKMNYLDALLRQDGQVDCILVGSSQVNVGLDPAIINRVYQQQTGSELHCINFGLSTLTADAAAPLTRMLVKRYHPHLLVFEVSARSFDKHFGNLVRPLVESPWMRYQAGEKTPEGWAIDTFYVYRYYVTFKLWQQPYSRNVLLRNWQRSGSLGFAPTYGTTPLDTDNLLSLDFRIAGPNWEGFKQILALDGQTRLVVIEAPVEQAYLPYYVHGGLDAYRTEFVQPVQAELAARHIPFWSAQAEIGPQIPDQMWFDPRHLNTAGSVLFSTWLAQKMAQEIPPELFR